MKKLLALRPELTRPAVWTGVFTLAGLVLCAMGLELTFVIVILAAMALVSAAAVRKSVLPLVIALAVSCGAAARFAYIDRRAGELRQKYDGVEAAVVGRVYSEPEYSGSVCDMIIKTKLGLIELRSYREQAVDCEVGDGIAVQARLSAPEAQKNDYGFDNRSYLLSRGIYLMAENTGAPKITAGKAGLRRMAAKVRDYAVELGGRLLHGSAWELYPAVIFGDGSRLSGGLKNALSAAGLSHIAAVSGMHLAVVAVIIMFLLMIPFGRRRFARLFVIPAMVFFAFVTGCEPSVVRACVMNIIFQLAMVLYRESDGLSSLAAAFVLMCLYNPMLIFSTGFQPSAASTLGILLFYKPFMGPAERLLKRDFFDRGRMTKICARLLRGTASVIAVSLSAQLASFPISARTFHYISVYALPANLLTVPLMTPIMAAGLALAAFGRIPVLGGAVGTVCGALLDYVAFVARKISALPGAVLPVMEIPILLVLAYCALVLALFALMKKRRFMSGALGLMFAVFAVIGGVRVWTGEQKDELSFINVGRGDSTLFRVNGRSVLVDGGRNGRTVADYLAARGLFRLDCTVLTSSRLEHISGLITLVDEGYVERLFIPEDLEMTDRLETLLMAAEDAGTAVTMYGSGDSINSGGLVLRQIDCDGESVQLAADYGGTKILLCGDSVMDWKDCDIVKMPYHGSGSYNYYPELHRHNPAYAVMTAAGMSAAEKSKAMPVLKDMGIPCYVPAEDGTVNFTLGEEIEVRTTRENDE